MDGDATSVFQYADYGLGRSGESTSSNRNGESKPDRSFIG
jgi:hypothetical protein